MNIQNTVKRYTISTAGIAFVALGIAFSIVANLGVSALNAPTCALAARWPGLVIGSWDAVSSWNFILYSFFILIQMLVLRSRFRAADVLQLVANFLMSAFLAFFCSALARMGIVADGLATRISMVVLSILFTAVGVSMEVVSDAWMLPAEMTVRACTIAFGGLFSRNKIYMDCFLLGCGAIMCLAFFGSAFGSESTEVVGLGTVMLAFGVGMAMRLTDPLAERMFGKLLKKY